MGRGGIFAIFPIPGDSRAAHRAVGPGGDASVLPSTARVLTCISASQPRHRGLELAPSAAVIYFFNLI